MNLDVFMFFHKHTIKCPQLYSDEICVTYTDFSGNVPFEPHNLRESVVFIYAYKVVETFYLSIKVTKHYMSALELPKG